MNLTTILYADYETALPQSGNIILGQTKGENIVVYQAFNNGIANYAVKHQRFGGANYSFSRMTWIKPNFLWMMYRSGWAEKENQNRILAIEITLLGFQWLLNQGVLSSFHSRYGTHENWKNQLNESLVRVQWDPDHDPQGRKLERRAVQIGFKGDALQKFNEDFIQSITDITPFVVEQKRKLDQNDPTFSVIREQVIEIFD